MEDQFVRKIFYYKSFYLDFFGTLRDDVKKKFNWTLKLIATLNRVPAKYLKHIKDSTGLYEIRVESDGNIFRVFCFFDKGKMIIHNNGFQKKSQKIPRKEIEMAEKLKKQYFDEKRNN